MNIIGHGIDMMETSEMERWIQDPRDPLLSRCFVQEELDQIGNSVDRAQRLAGRFAAKEAVLKALGTGFGGGVALSHVIIQAQTNMAPTVRLTGGAAAVAAERGIAKWHLSISHTDRTAVASAIAVGGP